MESKPDGQYRYICHTVDHFSKIHVIFPLVSKEARVVTNGIKIEAINYWLQKKRDLIAERFTNNFITESLKFILTNNNVLFDEHMYLQLRTLGYLKPSIMTMGLVC